MKKCCLSLLLLLLLITVFLSACASYYQKKAQEFMQEAMSYNTKGDIYSAVQNALKALTCDNQNEEAKRFVTANYNRAIEQKVNILNKMTISMDNLQQIRDELKDLEKMQSNLKDYKFIQVDVADVGSIKNRYETSVTKESIKEIDNLLKQGDAEKSRKQTERYIELGLPTDEQFVSSVNRLQLLYLSQNNYVSLISFTKRNKEFTGDETLKKVYKGLLSFAVSDENTNKRRALDTYTFLLELDKSDKTIMSKISTLRNELITMLAVLDLENQTDEFISINNKDFANSLKAGLDDKDNLIEVILQDDGINEIKDRSINYDHFRNKKETNIKFENNIHYLIAPQIANLRINKQPPSMVTKNASWKFNSWNDAVAVAFAEVDAYGRYKVQYYQYDEYNEKVNGRMVLDIIVYDVMQKKIVLKDRLEVQTEDSVTWAENPMAVGIVNKIPATIYPIEIQTLMNQKRPIKTDDELKKDLMSKLTTELVIKVRSTLFP